LMLGAPTRRRLLGASSAGVLTEWIWDMPSSDSCFSVSFTNGVPNRSFFFPRTYLQLK